MLKSFLLARHWFPLTSPNPPVLSPSHPHPEVMEQCHVWRNTRVNISWKQMCSVLSLRVFAGYRCGQNLLLHAAFMFVDNTPAVALFSVEIKKSVHGGAGRKKEIRCACILCVLWLKDVFGASACLPPAAWLEGRALFKQNIKVSQFSLVCSSSASASVTRAVAG